jgi:hypothetical protein
MFTHLNRHRKRHRPRTKARPSRSARPWLCPDRRAAVPDALRTVGMWAGCGAFVGSTPTTTTRTTTSTPSCGERRSREVRGYSSLFLRRYAPCLAGAWDLGLDLYLAVADCNGGLALSSTTTQLGLLSGLWLSPLQLSIDLSLSLSNITTHSGVRVESGPLVRRFLCLSQRPYLLYVGSIYASTPHQPSSLPSPPHHPASSTHPIRSVRKRRSGFVRRL